jgi:hypothetical protein
MVQYGADSGKQFIKGKQKLDLHRHPDEKLIPGRITLNN